MPVYDELKRPHYTESCMSQSANDYEKVEETIKSNVQKAGREIYDVPRSSGDVTIMMEQNISYTTTVVN